jgi:hypothetical protein
MINRNCLALSSFVPRSIKGHDRGYDPDVLYDRDRWADEHLKPPADLGVWHLFRLVAPRRYDAGQFAGDEFFCTADDPEN